MPLRVCRISQNFQPENDGLSRHVLNLSLSQAKTGHQIHLFQPFIGCYVQGGIHFEKIRVPAGGPFGTKWFTFLFCLSTAREIWKSRRLHFDLIHCHGDAIEAFIIGLLGKMLALPVVLTVHGDLNRRRLYRLTAPFLFWFVDRIIPISRPVRLSLERLGIKKEKINVISTGIHFDAFANALKNDKKKVRTELGIPEDALVAVATGRFHPVKGFRYLVEAAKRFKGETPPFFYIIGNGPEMPDLLKMAQGVRNVFLPGKKSHPEILSYLRAADVFVLSSVDFPWQSEAIPTALIEALAMGLPVVATNTGEAAFLVSEGLNGYIIPQRDPAALHSALVRLLQDTRNPSFAEAASVFSRKLAVERDWTAVAARVESVYAEFV